MRIRIVLPLLVALASPVEAEKPNIVLVMADDMGWGQTRPDDAMQPLDEFPFLSLHPGFCSLGS